MIDKRNLQPVIILTDELKVKVDGTTMHKLGLEKQ